MSYISSKCQGAEFPEPSPWTGIGAWLRVLGGSPRRRIEGRSVQRLQGPGLGEREPRAPLHEMLCLNARHLSQTSHQHHPQCQSSRSVNKRSSCPCNALAYRKQ
eukprot:6459862-Amphidinium_carterae.1